MHKMNNNFIENEHLYLMMLLKLNNLGDPRGYLRLSTYYYDRENYTKALEFAKIGSDNNHGLSKINLYAIQKKINPKHRDLSLLISALEMKEYQAINNIILYYMEENLTIETFAYIEYGIYKEFKSSLKILEAMFTNPTDLYLYLIKLPFNNKLIGDKVKELTPLLDQTIIDQRRGSVGLMITEKNEILIGGISRELIEKYG